MKTMMSLDLLIDVFVTVVVNARKCDGDGRARRDTTCHVLPHSFALSLSRI